MAKTTVSAGYIAANAITATELAANSVTAAAIASGAILSIDIGANSVSSTAIAANAVNTSEVASNAIGTAQIASNAVTAASIATNAVGADQISPNAVKASELASDALSGQNFTGNVTFDTSTLYVDATNNRVGIGTASPTTTLDASGIIRSKADAALNDAQIGKFSFYNTNSNASANPERAYIFGGRQNSAWGGYMSFYTSTLTNAATEKLRITEGGKVGIGTDSPEGKLTISNNGAGGFEFTPDTTTFSVANSNYIASYDRSASAYRDIVFDLGGVESQSIRFKAGGNVGIGTSSPSYPLHILGSHTVYGAELSTSSTATTSYNVMRWTQGTGSGAPTGYIGTGGSAVGNSGFAGAFGIGTQTSAPVTFLTNDIERMRIDSSGNVGIGRTPSSRVLDVSGAGIRLLDTNSYSQITIGASGWDIGYPYQRLDSFNTDGTGYYWALGHRKTDGTKTIRMLINDESSRQVTVIDQLNVSTFASNELGGSGNYPTFTTNVVIRNSGDSYLNGGDVGIGTTNPSAKLHLVDGQAHFERAGNVNRGNILIGPTGSGTTKWATIVGTHYNEATGSGNGSGNAGVNMISSESAASYNKVWIGHGIYEANPATEIRLGTHTSTTHTLGGTTHMIMDSSGRITTPSQPCFSAYRSGGYTTSANSTLIFNQTHWQVGSMYNTSTGIMTAPVTGKYFVSGTILVNASAGTEFDMIISTSNRNMYAGQPGRIEVQAGISWGDGYISLGFAEIIEMDANDTCQIYFASPGSGTFTFYGDAGGLWSRFCGMLIG